MNSLAKYGLIVSSIGLLLQLIGFVYFFGFFRGTFQEFKDSTTAALKRLEGVFFTDVKVVPHQGAEHAFGAVAEESQTTSQRRRR